jgi:hypothetical protein
LKDEVKGHDIIHKDMIKSYEQKIKHIQTATSFKIEALESALIKSKMKANV